jgi:hypothetical protein
MALQRDPARALLALSRFFLTSPDNQREQFAPTEEEAS